MITLRNGRFGPYVQLGDGDKPKRASIPEGHRRRPTSISNSRIKLLSLPREVGTHPETGQPITANFGRFGPYVQHEKSYASLESPEDVFTVGLNHAVTLIAERKAKGFKRRGPEPLKELGPDPGAARPIKVMKGRYGPYVTDGTTNATIPGDGDADSITLDDASALIAARVAKGGGKKKKKPAKAAKASQSGSQAKETNQIRNGQETCQEKNNQAENTRTRGVNLRRRVRASNAPVLDKARVLEALASEPGATKRDLARMLGVKGSDRITLKRILKELDQEGAVTGSRKRGYERPGTLPEVTVLEITGQDMDGELLARPQRWESQRRAAEDHRRARP